MRQQTSSTVRWYIHNSNSATTDSLGRETQFSYLRTSGRIGEIRWLVTIDTLQWLPILKLKKKRKPKIPDEFLASFES